MAVLALAVLCGGCQNMKKMHALGEKAVHEFHDLYNAGNYAEIFNEAYPLFGNSITLPDGKPFTVADFKGYLQLVQRSLGKVTGTRETSWHVNDLRGKTYLLLSQKTTFEKGEAAEMFIFVMRGGQALLFNYQIDSPALGEN